jgi:excisionase family DNA binding protein
MGGRRPNPRRLKIHRSYTVEEAARQLRVHRNTIRAYIKQGLPVVDERRPTLILGRDLQGFLEGRREQLRAVCGPRRIYCVKCRAPQAPAGFMADYIPLTSTSGNLRGICPECHKLVHRRVALAKIEAVRGQIDVSFPHLRERIGESPSPSLDSDLEEPNEHPCSEP